MPNRHQRFLMAMKLGFIEAWDPLAGPARKQFTTWGFDITIVDDTEFTEEDIVIQGNVIGTLPTKRTTYSVSNDRFILRFEYVLQDFSAQLDPSIRTDIPRIGQNMSFEVDDPDAFDYWLDQRVFQRDLNLCIPEETPNSATGEGDGKHS